MYKFDAVPIDPEEIKRRYLAMQKLEPAPGPELRGPGYTMPPTMPPGTQGLPIPTPDPVGPPPPGGHSTRKMAGGILDAVGQIFQPPEQSMPVPQMPTDNETQRQARIAALRLPGYRYGGPVKKGQPVIVNDGAGVERFKPDGPSVFVPPTDGVVIPNVADVPPPTGQVPGKAEYYVDATKDPYPSPVANTAPQIQLPQVTAPVTPPMNEVPKSPPVVANVPVPESVIPAVTAPANSGSGWDSDTQAMKDQREYDRTRPATLPEAEGEYNRILNSKEHPNKFLSGLFLALQGISHVYGDQTPIKSLADARRDNKLDAQGRIVKTLEDQRKFETEDAYRRSQADYNSQRPDIEYAKIAQRRDAAQAVTKRAAMNIEFRQGIAKPYIDDEGYVWKQFLNDPKRPMEPLENPITHEQEFVPGEEGIQWKDPNTKQTITIKAKQSVMPSATIAAGNAGREQSAAKDNSEGAFKAQKENVDNFMQWQTANTGLLQSALKADTTLENNAVVQGLVPQITAANEELQALANQPIPENEDEKAAAARVKRIEDLKDKIGELTSKTLTEVEKSASGKALADQIRANLPKRPPKLVYTPYKPVRVEGGVSGKPVPRSKDPLGIFQ